MKRQQRFRDVQPGAEFHDHKGRVWVKFAGPERPPGSLNATRMKCAEPVAMRSFGADEIVDVR